MNTRKLKSYIMKKPMYKNEEIKRMNFKEQ